MTTDFDALVQETITKDATRDDIMAALNTLYGHAFALEHWFFIPRGDFPNVHPYTASNPEYAGGQPMIRAFTDTARLQRFAQENHLTEADGGQTVLSIPTGEIVPYLEQFMADGAHGLWFNSDTGSHGFFVPLKQLRPIKDHLARLGWKMP